MSKLGILVTQYNEDEKILKNLLDSIAVQQNVDLKEIEVIMTEVAQSLVQNFLINMTLVLSTYVMSIREFRQQEMPVLIIQRQNM